MSPSVGAAAAAVAAAAAAAVAYRRDERVGKHGDDVVYGVPAEDERKVAHRGRRARVREREERRVQREANGEHGGGGDDEKHGHHSARRVASYQLSVT